MSELYGTTMKANPMQSASRSARQQQDKEGQAQMQTSSNQGASWSWREGAALSANEMMALPKGQVLATTLADQRYVFLGQRLNSIPLFAQLPPPDSLHLPQPIYRPRKYTDWSTVPGKVASLAAATAANLPQAQDKSGDKATGAVDTSPPTATNATAVAPEAEQPPEAPAPPETPPPVNVTRKMR